MRFAYIDSNGNEVPIPSVDALSLRIELGAISEDTELYDAQADLWGPAHTHEIFHTLSRTSGTPGPQRGSRFVVSTITLPLSSPSGLTRGSITPPGTWIAGSSPTMTVESFSGWRNRHRQVPAEGHRRGVAPATDTALFAHRRRRQLAMGVLATEPFVMGQSVDHMKPWRPFAIVYMFVRRVGAGIVQGPRGDVNVVLRAV